MRKSPPNRIQDPAPAKAESVIIPAGLRGPARFHFCLDTAGLRGVLLAMSMGVGKTMVALMVLLWLKAVRVVTACPLRVAPVSVA